MTVGNLVNGALFQFLIGKVQPKFAKAYLDAIAIKEFQFLIGKVQLLKKLLTRLKRNLFQFLIGKVQLNSCRHLCLWGYGSFQFLIGKVQRYSY